MISFNIIRLAAQSRRASNVRLVILLYYLSRVTGGSSSLGYHSYHNLHCLTFMCNKATKTLIYRREAGRKNF